MKSQPKIFEIEQVFLVVKDEVIGVGVGIESSSSLFARLGEAAADAGPAEFFSDFCVINIVFVIIIKIDDHFFVFVLYKDNQPEKN